MNRPSFGVHSFILPRIRAGWMKGGRSAAESFSWPGIGVKRSRSGGYQQPLIVAARPSAACLVESSLNRCGRSLTRIEKALG